MGKRKCIFCNSDQSFSNEHIFPQWLLKEFNITKSGLLMIHNSYGIDLSERKLTFNNFVNGLVCRDCNNGWMSQLEVSVKDTLINLMNFEPEGIQQLKEKHSLVAKWAIKTAMALNYGTNYRRIIPKRHLRMLYKGILPQTIFVTLSFIDGYDEEGSFSWFQSQDNLHIGINTKELMQDERFKDMYRITMQFRHLLLKVVYTPFFDYKFYGETRDIEIYPQLLIYKEENDGIEFFYDDMMKFDVGGVFRQY